MLVKGAIARCHDGLIQWDKMHASTFELPASWPGQGRVGGVDMEEDAVKTASESQN